VVTDGRERAHVSPAMHGDNMQRRWLDARATPTARGGEKGASGWWSRDEGDGRRC